MGMDANRVQALSAIARYPDVSAAIDDGIVSQVQGIAIGQAAGDPAIAAAMVGLVGKATSSSPLKSDGVVRKVAKAARELDATLPAAERVARAAVLVGAAPSPTAMKVIRPQYHGSSGLHQVHNGYGTGVWAPVAGSQAAATLTKPCPPESNLHWPAGGD